MLKELREEAALRGEPMQQQNDSSPPSQEMFDWDAFICHATEDKDSFVRELAQKLVREGIRVWYDESTLQVGDSLRRSIDKGLSSSRYGIVVLSHSFFRKEWPQNELNGLVTRERHGEKVILPVWLDVDKEDVARYSTILADRLAARAKDGIEKVITQLLFVLNPSPSGQQREPTEYKTEAGVEEENTMTKELISPRLLSTTVRFEEEHWDNIKGEMFAVLINWIDYEEVKDTTLALNFPGGSFRYIHQELQGLILSSNNLPLEKIIERFGKTYPTIIFTIDKPFNFGDLVKRSRGGIRTIDFLSNKTMKFSLRRASITLTNSDKGNTITIETDKLYAFRSAIPPVSYNSIIDYLEKDPPPEELENYLQKAII